MVVLVTRVGLQIAALAESTRVMAVGLMDGLLACSLCFGLMSSQLGTFSFMKLCSQASILFDMLDVRKALQL